MSTKVLGIHVSKALGVPYSINEIPFTLVNGQPKADTALCSKWLS